MLCKDLRAAVKTVVGTCVSLGVLIENKSAVKIEKDINVKDIGYIENVRQKLDNVDLADLMQSIKQEGLMQPIGLVKRKANWTNE